MSQAKMRKINPILSAVCLLALMSMSVSCASRVIYVPHGEPVRLAESVKAKVWVIDANGKSVRSNNRIIIHEGWYALPKDK
jgi:acid phosphatase class B